MMVTNTMVLTRYLSFIIKNILNLPALSSLATSMISCGTDESAAMKRIML